MNSRRMIILLVAVFMGAAASYAIYTYVGNVKTEAAQEVEVVKVWRVVETIPKGTPAADAIAQGFIGEVEVDISARPLTAIDKADQIAGLVAVIDIPPNITVVEGLFVEAGVVNTGITDRLDEMQMVTVTLSLDEINGAANFIEPGDRINILALRTRPGVEVSYQEAKGNKPWIEELASEAAEGGDEATPDAISATYPMDVRYVYQYAEVLAVGGSLPNELGANSSDDPNAAAAAAANAASGLITLAVPPEALQVILGVDPSTLYLSLVPQNYVPRAIPQFEYELVLPGEADENGLTPYTHFPTEAGTEGGEETDGDVEAKGDAKPADDIEATE